MPGEEGFISALTAPVVNLAIAAVVVALIAVVLMALLYLMSNRQAAANINRMMDGNSQLLNALVTQGNQNKTFGQQLDSMIHILERGQADQHDLTGTIIAVREALVSHEGHSDERSKTLLDRIETVSESITNLIEDTGLKVAAETGRMVDASATRMMDAIKPLIESLMEIKASIVDAKAQSLRQQQEQALKSQAAFDVIEAKIGHVGERVIGVIQVMQGEIEREKPVGDVDSGGAVGGDISVGAASGSTGDNGTGKPDGASGTADGSAA